MRLLLVALLAGACLALSELEKNVLAAIQEAQTILEQRNSNLPTIKENGESVSQTQKANGDSQLSQLRGDLMAEVTKILVEKYGVDILSQLEEIDIDALVSQMSRKKRYANAPTSSNDKCQENEPRDCNDQNSSNLRTISGVCNNRAKRDWGKAVTAIRRLLGKASYSDGIGAIRTKSSSGSLLPSTRDVSNRLHIEGATPVFDYMTNHLHMQFGQFIAHDIIFMPSSVGPNGETLDCSACNSSSVTDNCAPIKVPSGDSYFPANGCIRLTRSLNGQKGLGQRTPIDQNTHFLDLSAVYGSDGCVSADVRSFKNGELKEFISSNKYVLPPQAKNDSNCQSKNPYYCFLAGDFRNSLHPGLIPLHTVFIKMHNSVAKAMRKIRPDWNDERTYQEARRLMIARYQHHVYSEYLPKLLGAQTMKEFGLTPLTSGYFTGYDQGVNPSLSGEFTAAAFRFGHSQARKDFPRKTNSNQTAGDPVDLGQNIFYTDSLYQTSAGGTESMLDGMLQMPGMAVDRQFSFPIRNQLFEIRGKPASGVDLVAVNIMRGRDIGLFPYNEYRTAVGLPKAKKFDDLLGQMDSANVNALKAVYSTVDDIDLYSGILMERPANGAMLGRTGAYIIAETFSGLKKGDRFFYETKTGNSRSLTPDELATIRKTSLARLFCSVTDQMDLVNKDVFDLNSPRVACNKLVDLDISFFVPKSDEPASGREKDHSRNSGSSEEKHKGGKGKGRG